MKKLLLSIFAVAAAGFGCYSAAAETTATVGDKYTRVESTADITADGEYIICYQTNAMGAQSGTKFRTRIADGVTLSDDSKEATIKTAGVVTFSIIDGTTTGSYAFKFDDKAFMQCTNTSNGNVSNSTSLAATCDMTLSLTNGVAVLTFVKNGNNGNNKFQYNSNSGQERFTNYKTGSQRDCSIYKKNSGTSGDETKCATPTFSPAEGAVEAGTVVTISCATADATLTYTVNGESHQSETNTANVTINEATTITATASKSGLENSDEAKATYTIKEVVNATSISDAYTRLNVAALANNAETEVFTVAFEPVVTYVNGANVYIHDGEKYGLIFKYDSGLNAGDKVAANWQSTIKNYSNLYEFIPAATLSANGTADVPAPVEITPAQLTADNQSMIVVMNGVVLAAATPSETATGSARGYKGKVDGTEINLFNNFKNTSVEAGTYNITGIIGVYNTTVQLQPISFEKVQVVETKCATPTFSHNAGVIAKGTEVTISCSTEGSTLMYTVNDEIFESETSTATVTINETTTISAVASKTGLEDSEEANVTYIVNEQGGDDPVEGTAVFKVSTVTDPANGAVFVHNAQGNLIDQSFTDNGVTLAFTANNPSNNVGIFNEEKEVRWYANNFITVTPAQKTIITEIYVRTVANSKGNFTATVNEKVAGTVSGTGVGASNPITWTGAANAPILLTPNAQIRFSYMTVTFKEDTTGVEDMTVADENAPVEYYNLQGIRISEPAAGSMVIRRQGNTVTKVLVK